jgi:hypothetical protein
MMMNNPSGPSVSTPLAGLVPGASSLARAARLAGALAELSITRLELAPDGGQPRVLRSRETDLPREIVALSRGRITPAGLDALFVIAPDRIQWTAFTPEAAKLIQARLG